MSTSETTSFSWHQSQINAYSSERRQSERCFSRPHTLFVHMFFAYCNAVAYSLPFRSPLWENIGVHIRACRVEFDRMQGIPGTRPPCPLTCLRIVAVAKPEYIRECRADVLEACVCTRLRGDTLAGRHHFISQIVSFSVV